MTLHVENESGNLADDLDPKALARRVVEAVLDFEDCPYEAEINLILTDNEAIRQMNREYRQIDRATDVLSFPMLEYESPSDFSAAEDGLCGSFNPETGELILGDIVVSMEKVAEQAEKYGHSREREFAFLIAHSMLHLCGYDHILPEEAAMMEARQASVLESLQILR